jgi:hypothetical protein
MEGGGVWRADTLRAIGTINFSSAHLQTLTTKMPIMATGRKRHASSKKLVRILLARERGETLAKIEKNMVLIAL